MKTLTTVSRTACLLAALSGCGTDPILLGEILETAQQGNDAPASDDPPAVPLPGTQPAPEAEPATPPGYTEEDDTEAQVLSLLDRYCGECHAGPDASSPFVSVDDVDAMIAEGVIIPGDRDNSRLYVRMIERTMPPFTVLPQPTLEEIDVIGQFIDSLEP